MADQETRAELNRLYWETDVSVSEISDRLGVSRRALYEDLEPLSADLSCPECGGALGFRNRTRASSGEAECAECGFEVEAEVEVDGSGADAAASEPAVEQEARAGRLSPARRVPATGGGAALGAALVAGLGVGAVAGYLLRRA